MVRRPVIHWSDGMTFTWDSNMFYDNGFYVSSGCLVFNKHFSIDQISTPAKGQAGGLGWYLKTGKPSSDASNVYGGAQLLLIPRETYYTGSNLDSKMYFTYAHQLVGMGISFGLPAGVGVSITGGHYDQQTYSYTYK